MITRVDQISCGIESDCAVICEINSSLRTPNFIGRRGHGARGGPVSATELIRIDVDKYSGRISQLRRDWVHEKKEFHPLSRRAAIVPMRRGARHRQSLKLILIGGPCAPATADGPAHGPAPRSRSPGRLERSRARKHPGTKDG
ncbi:hypothetical protein EVAR_21140_1 [Eumeta japonica]|uniref:Uncharacterized protein n=1 Tax=Eumeta variegata TaxID=151549 RepID=A0A4C1VSL7_EUMVA|nr:hypothetical protein EVAR_21140_1 [Eumeta japonica]